MNPPRADLLARRRERLVQRSAVLRELITEELRGVQPALTWIDRIQDGWLWLRSHPLAAVAAPLLLTLWRPRRAVGLGMRLWSAWKLVQRLRAPRAVSPPPPSARRRR
ncbi:YqjK family protein [Hydrogenophaga sp. 2FB]|uniref:YqjK family protein n=1 Tax=Hydrogenophaga sp. 2FB TaxID=2502187 RepID=UPI0010F96FF4|nr:YqjK family protein [Hydrogenophaga sp. 2FB]